MTPYVVLGGIAFAGYSLFALFSEYRRSKRVAWFHLLTFFVLIAIVIGLLVPPIARLRRDAAGQVETGDTR